MFKTFIEQKKKPFDGIWFVVFPCYMSFLYASINEQLVVSTQYYTETKIKVHLSETYEFHYIM